MPTTEIFIDVTPIKNLRGPLLIALCFVCRENYMQKCSVCKPARERVGKKNVKTSTRTFGKKAHLL